MVLVISRGIAVQHGVSCCYGNERRKGLCKAGEIPQADLRLLIKSVAPARIGVVADVAGVVTFHETERAVIESQPEYGHVVGIHHAMRETDRLPLSHQFGGALGDFMQK